MRLNKRELRKVLRSMTDSELSTELNRSNIALTRGMVISRSGVALETQIAEECEREKQRRDGSL